VRPALDQIIHEPTDLLSAAYYRGQASRAKELAQAATTLAVRNRLEKVARECDRLAGLVDVVASNIPPNEGQMIVERHLNWRPVA
jgi:chorismate synthase